MLCHESHKASEASDHLWYFSTGNKMKDSQVVKGLKFELIVSTSNCFLGNYLLFGFV